MKDKDRELREILKDYGTKLACSNDKCTICQAQLKKNISQIKALVMESLGEDNILDIVFDTLYSDETDKCLEIKDKLADSIDGVLGYSKVSGAIAKSIIAEMKKKWKS